MSFKLALTSSLKALVAAAVLSLAAVALLPKAEAQTFNYNLCFATPLQFKTFYLQYRVSAIPVCGYSPAQMTDLVSRIDRGLF